MKRKLKLFKSLSGKFTFGVILILLFMLCGTLLVNSRLAKRYYMYQQREYVRQIGNKLREELDKGTVPKAAVEFIEEKENVLIVYSQEKQSPDILSSELREAFRQKGLGFQKFWLWEGDYTSAVQNGSQFRLYVQDKLNYSILVQYLSIDTEIYAVAAIVPNAEGFIKIINQFGFLLYSISIFISIFLIFIFIKHITTPLTRIREFTEKLSSHSYEPLDIKTGDELEAVAGGLNEMGNEIEQYQRKLELKNEQMKQLLSDVAHDLKTPISLVGMYASGIKDGLDDGTFLDTIIRQNNKMSQIVESLLYLSRIELKKYTLTNVNLDQLLIKCIDDHRLLFIERGLKLQIQIKQDISVIGNEELITELFSNFLSNAAKYASLGTVEVLLFQKGQSHIFKISNEIDNMSLNTERIWEPFYVGQSSRSKSLSGTGLGLSIVKKIAEQFGYSVECSIQANRICFEIEFSFK